MFGKALYYPYTRVPEDSWFTRILLYWETVASIVPSDFIENPELLGPYMQRLIQDGLVEPVIPGAHLWQVNKFDESFLRHVDVKYSSVIGEGGSSWADLHAEKLGHSIHMEKLYTLVDALCDRGLARKPHPTNHSPWIKVEPHVADDFMFYLAGVLGQLPEGPERFEPVTNSRRNLTGFDASMQSLQRSSSIREILLAELMPAPEGPISASQLLRFKERTVDLRRHFIRKLERQIITLSAVAGDDERSFLMRTTTELLKDEVAELIAKMAEEPRWPKLSLANLSAVMSSGLGIAKGIVDQDWVFGAGAGLLGLIPAIIDAIGPQKTDITNSPFAYVAEVAKEFAPQS